MKRNIASMNLALIVLIIALIAALNFVAYSFSGTITSALCGTGIDFSGEASQQARAEAMVLAENICADGITLLKNENDVLPFKGDTNLNVFGWGACDNGFVYQGFGSGGGSKENKKSLYSGLREWGITINESLADAYNGLKYVRGDYDTECKINEAPESFYTDSLMTEAKEFSKRALVVISRKMGEGVDTPMFQTVNDKQNKDRHFLQLAAEEELMINKVTEHFEDVIVLLNSTNVMEAGFLENDKIDAALTMYAPGNHGTTAVGKILAGDVTPSGKTVDTWAYDLKTAATYANSGVNGTHHTPNAGAYVDYAENIYLGYYWYETADKEGYWDGYKSDYGSGYDGVVQYPFGYGLSYTEFDWTLEEVSIPDGGTLAKDSEITFKVFVSNKGGMPGQDVVQLYFTPPYTPGGIEKPYVKLGGFAKTSVLDPGEGEQLTITVDLRQMASYDCYDLNNNGFMGYEAEKGTYGISLRTDAHTVATLSDSRKAQFEYKVDADVRYDKDVDTGAEITNRFTNVTNPTSGASSTYTEPSLSAGSKTYSVDGADADCNIAYMKRSDMKNMFPTAKETRVISSEFVEKAYKINAPKMNEGDVMPEYNSTKTAYTLDDFIFEKKDAEGNVITDEDGNPVIEMIEYENQMWEDLVRQLDIPVIADLVSRGGWGTAEIKSINKPWLAHADGPSGFNTRISGLESGVATNYPCATLIASTWNWKMAYQYGVAVGVEADAADIAGWYGPACNIHRSPMSGRNFEYYSEDPYISGIMASYAIIGAQEKGLYAFVKHFVVADTEPGREGKSTWLTEQTLREIYLLPFEYTVKLGKTTAIMTAYNRVGSTRSSGSYALNTEVLRGEWGFKGCVISDYYSGNQGMSMDIDEFIRAGNDLRLLPEGKTSDFDDLSNPTTVIALQRSAKNILYSYVKTRYIAANSQGLELSSILGSKSEVFPWWIIVLVATDVVIAGGCVFWGVMVIKKSRKPQQM